MLKESSLNRRKDSKITKIMIIRLQIKETIKAQALQKELEMSEKEIHSLALKIEDISSYLFS